MTIKKISQALREKIRTAALEQFGVELDQVVVEVPPKPEFGDLAFPAGFELAKKIKQATGEKKNPRELAEQLRAALESVEFVDRVDIAGAGYLNVFFDRSRFLSENAAADPLPALARANDRSARESLC
jgi:arginyl-tRNA synthetase